MRRAAMVLLMLASVPAYGRAGRPADLRSLLSGKTVPLSLQLKELDGEWRRFMPSGPYELAGMMQMFAALFGGAGSGVCYTKGETIALGKETYLIAYRPPAPPLDLARLMGPGAEPPFPPKPVKLTAETPLALCLLNLASMGNLNDIRPFNLEQEEAAAAEAGEGGIVGLARTQAAQATSLSNLKQLGLALVMYASDYDEVLPPMQDAETVKAALEPYVSNEQLFVHPTTGEPYQPNPILSYHKLAHISNPAEFVTFYEASPWEDGSRGVAFLDGHAKRVDEEEWELAKRASKIR